MVKLNCCMGDMRSNGNWLHLYSSTGYLGKDLEFHEVDIHNDGRIEYYYNGHKVEEHAECDQLMEMFLAGKLKIIA